MQLHRWINAMREGAGNGSRSRTARAGRPVSWIDDLYEPALREQQGGPPASPEINGARIRLLR
jgi:hypothetical protein